jgi:biotin carboxyl carrier protein
MKLKITVHGVGYEVDVDILDWGELASTAALPAMPRNGAALPVPNGGAAPPAAGPAPAPKPKGPAPAGGDGDIVSPIAGTVVEVKVATGDDVADGDTVVVIEAMKMNTPIKTSRAAKVKKVAVAKGDSVREGQVLVELE